MVLLQSAVSYDSYAVLVAIYSIYVSVCIDNVSAQGLNTLHSQPALLFDSRPLNGSPKLSVVQLHQTDN